MCKNNAKKVVELNKMKKKIELSKYISTAVGFEGDFL